MAAAASSCNGGTTSELPPALARLDDFFLVEPVRPGGDWLLCGRFELTLAEYAPEVDHPVPDLPATGLDLEACRAWCAPRGLRLPTADEWTALATAGAGSGWAPSRARMRNDIELGMGRPLPVGVFERGRNPLGGYDFFGNVWERVEPPSPSPPDPGMMPGYPATQAAGGSYTSGPVMPADYLDLAAEDTLEDVGMRYVADASAYLLEQVAPRWGGLDAAGRAAVTRSFSRWLPPSRASLASGLREQGAPASLCDALADA